MFIKHSLIPIKLNGWYYTEQTEQEVLRIIDNLVLMTQRRKNSLKKEREEIFHIL